MSDSLFGERDSLEQVERGRVFAPKFDDEGLIPAIAVCVDSGEVVMQAYMNREALNKTVETGEAHYWSRSRGELWHKGATSGHVQKVKELRVDCDQDCLLLKVEVLGPGSCHLGYPSCFHRAVVLPAQGDGPLQLRLVEEQSYDAQAVYGGAPPPDKNLTAMTSGGAANSDDFYRALQPFSRFADFTDAKHYRPAPEDWIAVVADIESSTEAIAAGHYKRVNMIGAGVIVAVLNACPEIALPYVFGGDGATLLIPPRLKPVVVDALRRTRHFADSAFGLRLRIGIVPLSELKRRGAEVRIAKYQLSPGNDLAMFAGHGVALAERLVKDPADDSYRLPASEEDDPPDLEGLSCRWEPLTSARGTMLTVLVNGSAGGSAENALYSEVVAKIESILASDANPSPATERSLRQKWPPSGARLEALATGGKRGFWRALRRVYVETFIYLVFQKFNLSAGGFNARRYTEELRSNTDFRKFDDMLRMVLDCSEEEAARIEDYLAGQRAQGRLAYGLHRSEQALMTCVVFSLAESRHVHFIDGADGGYALAALQLKAQMQDAEDGV